MMKKLSESLQELANQIAQIEKKIAVVEKQNQENMKTAIDTSKADAKARQDEFKAKVNETKAAVASQWADLQASYNRQVEQIRGNAEASKETRQLNRAMNRAADAEGYAAASIAFAIMAIDDAGIATLEAIEARAYADALANTKMTA
jgi:hypothetical protein